MCGIIALFAPGVSLPADHNALTSQLEAGLEKIAHRGPDAHGIWIDESSRCGEPILQIYLNDSS